jgi:N-acetylneuraminate synthase
MKHGGRYPKPKPVSIGHLKVGSGYPRFIVGEIGINHNGSLEIAKRLIDVAVEAKAQAVKFQKRTVNVVYTPEELAKPRAVDRSVLEHAIKRGVLNQDAAERLQKSDFQESTNGDLKWALEFTANEYREIFQYCKERNMLCFASPWDIGSVDFLESLAEEVGLPCYKIASASITDLELLRKVKSTGRPIILSTGMSTPEEIDRAVKICGPDNLIILHTVSTYPSEEKDLNLRALNRLQRLYPEVTIGYSGHERGIAPTMAAAIIGAMVIERHITLDRTMYGSDQSASLEPHEFQDLIRGIREIEAAAQGDGIKRVITAEVPIREKLRRK